MVPGCYVIIQQGRFLLTIQRKLDYLIYDSRVNPENPLMKHIKAKIPTCRVVKKRAIFCLTQAAKKKIIISGNNVGRSACVKIVRVNSMQYLQYYDIQMLIYAKTKFLN